MVGASSVPPIERLEAFSRKGVIMHIGTEYFGLLRRDFFIQDPKMEGILVASRSGALQKIYRRREVIACSVL
jgi:hypothetical protein